MKAPYKVLQKLVKSFSDDLGDIKNVFMFLQAPNLPFSYFEKKGFSLGEMPVTNSPLFVLYFLKEKERFILLKDMGDYLLVPKGDNINEV